MLAHVCSQDLIARPLCSVTWADAAKHNPVKPGDGPHFSTQRAPALVQTPELEGALKCRLDTICSAMGIGRTAVLQSAQVLQHPCGCMLLALHW